MKEDYCTTCIFIRKKIRNLGPNLLNTFILDFLLSIRIDYSRWRLCGQCETGLFDKYKLTGGKGTLPGCGKRLKLSPSAERKPVRNNSGTIKAQNCYDLEAAGTSVLMSRSGVCKPWRAAVGAVIRDDLS